MLSLEPIQTTTESIAVSLPTSTQQHSTISPIMSTLLFRSKKISPIDYLDVSELENRSKLQKTQTDEEEEGNDLNSKTNSIFSTSSSINELTNSLQMLSLDPTTQNSTISSSTLSKTIHQFSTKSSIMSTIFLSSVISSSNSTIDSLEEKHEFKNTKKLNKKTKNVKTKTKNVKTKTTNLKKQNQKSIKLKKACVKVLKNSDEMKTELNEKLDSKENHRNALSHFSICEDHMKRSTTIGMSALFTLAPHCMNREPGVTIFDSMNVLTLPDDNEKFENCNVVFGDFSDFDEFFTTESMKSDKSIDEKYRNKFSLNTAEKFLNNLKAMQQSQIQQKTTESNAELLNDSMRFFREFIPRYTTVK